MTAPLPVTVVGGYLGAGKTTLVNHLLRRAGGRRLAVLVNDFGDLPIDADLIEAKDEDVISIAGGCICCSFGSDVLAALMTLAARRPAPDQVVIEASGVALPGTVASALTLLGGFVLDGVVVIADAETVRARAADRYLADTVERQLGAADLVILNKVDLAPAQSLDPLRSWLQAMAPGARVIDAVYAQLPIEALLGVSLSAARPAAAPRLVSGTLRQPAAAEALFERVEQRVDHPVDARALAVALARPALGVVRAKGLLRDHDGSAVALQLVGARSTIAALPARSTEAHIGALVCIGLKGQLDRGAVASAVANAAHRVE